MPDFELNRFEIEWIEKLGQGNYGQMWKGLYGGVMDVAIKKLLPGIEIKHFAREFSVLKELDHNHVLKVIHHLHIIVTVLCFYQCTF